MFEKSINKEIDQLTGEWEDAHQVTVDKSIDESKKMAKVISKEEKKNDVWGLRRKNFSYI